MAENPPTAAPSKLARAAAIGAILIGGLAGGLIGWGIVDIECDESCTTSAAIGALIGAVVFAGGIAIVAILALRAMDEWDSTQRRRADKEVGG